MLAVFGVYIMLYFIKKSLVQKFLTIILYKLSCFFGWIYRVQGVYLQIDLDQTGNISRNATRTYASIYIRERHAYLTSK